MPTAEERTAMFRASQANSPTFPIRHCNGTAADTADGFDGTWIHTSAAKNAILSGGWKPELVTNTIYGAAVYLSRTPWHDGAPEIQVRLELATHEVQTDFPHGHGTGSSQNDVLWHLKEAGVPAGRSPGLGSSTLNRRIRDHFIGKGVKAIRFEEHGVEVVAVYDPSCIVVIPT